MAKILTTAQATACLSTAVILGGFVNIEFIEPGGPRVTVTFYQNRSVQVDSALQLSILEYPTQEAFMLAYGVAS